MTRHFGKMQLALAFRTPEKKIAIQLYVQKKIDDCQRKFQHNSSKCRNRVTKKQAKHLFIYLNP